MLSVYLTVLLELLHMHLATRGTKIRYEGKGTKDVWWLLLVMPSPKIWYLPLKYSTFHNNHSICCSMENTLLGRISLIIMIHMEVVFPWLRLQAPITFPLHPSPWICPHMAHIPARLALVRVCCSLLSQPKRWGKGVSVLNYHFFRIILDLKRRLYLFRCQQEPKALFQTGRNTQADLIA